MPLVLRRRLDAALPKAGGTMTGPIVFSNDQTGLGPSVSVKDFGNVGDGVTDDTSAHALNSGGKVCLISNATHKVSSS